MIEQTVTEIIKFSPVVGTLIYIIGIMGKALSERDKRINELIDRCINPCNGGDVDKNQNMSDNA